VVALGRYVYARQLVQQGSVDAAIVILRPLVAEGLLSPAFQEQAVLALGTALVRRSGARTGAGNGASGDDEARRLLLTAADTATRPAMRLFFRDRAERAARAALAPPAPAVATASSDPAWADRLLLGTWPDGPF
jgi:hypothetical protein